MEKYYTPTIEEFYSGFEFEIKKIGSEIWESKTFTRYDHLLAMDTIISHKDARVKHLDREDIESCGWEYCSSSSYDITFKIKVKDEMIDFLFLTFDTDDNTIKIDDGAMYETDRIFNGTIRNISELKKLMKQLNIQTK